MPLENGQFAELIGCNTPEEVYQRVSEWSSDLSGQDHKIRSTILSIHANLEQRLKSILYYYMIPLVSQWGDLSKDEKYKNDFEKTIFKMNFMGVYRLLKPCFDSFEHSDLSAISEINDVRGQVAHKGKENISYKGRNPFEDHDCFAQLFADSWAANRALSKFYERKIADPRAMAEHYAKYFHENS